MFPTPSKQDVEIIGLELLWQIKQAVSVPVVAIGGININNVSEVKKPGPTHLP